MSHTSDEAKLAEHELLDVINLARANGQKPDEFRFSVSPGTFRRGVREGWIEKASDDAHSQEPR